jgi:hypothetical protein
VLYNRKGQEIQTSGVFYNGEFRFFLVKNVSEGREVAGEEEKLRTFRFLNRMSSEGRLY